MDQSQAQRGHEPQAAGQPAIPIEVLRDRWAGLFESDGTATIEYTGKAERRYLELVHSLEAIIRRVSRADAIAEDDDSLGFLVDELYDGIRETIIARVHERGMAR